MAGTILLAGRPKPRSTGASEGGPLVALISLSAFFVALVLLFWVFGVRRWRKRSDAAFLPLGFAGEGHLRGARYRRELSGRSFEITMSPPRRYVASSIEMVLTTSTRTRASVSVRMGPEWVRSLLGVQEIGLGPAWERYLVRGQEPDAVARWTAQPEVGAAMARLLDRNDPSFFLIVEPGRLVVRGLGMVYALAEQRAFVEQMLQDLPMLAARAEGAGL